MTLSKMVATPHAHMENPLIPLSPSCLQPHNYVEGLSHFTQ